MTDRPSREAAIRAAFSRQAEACAALGSPFTARLCRLAAEHLRPDGAVASAVLAWEGEPSPLGDNLPLRLAGALHALVIGRREASLAAVWPPARPPARDEDLWRIIEDALVRHGRFVVERLALPPQTNEIGRSAPIHCGLSWLAGQFAAPFHLSELGASAGLNLLVDLYRYDFAGMAAGDLSSPVLLKPAWRGQPPPEAQPRIASRGGCDLAPLDVRNDEDRDRLLSFIWADQEERLARTRLAVGLARSLAEPLAIERADAADWLEARLAAPVPGRVHVVFHTIAWQYFPHSVQEKCRRLIERAGEHATRDAPLAWLSLEAEGEKAAAIHIQTWPGGARHRLGGAHFHGSWIDWQGAGGAARSE